MAHTTDDGRNVDPNRTIKDRLLRPRTRGRLFEVVTRQQLGVILETYVARQGISWFAASWFMLCCVVCLVLAAVEKPVSPDIVDFIGFLLMWIDAIWGMLLIEHLYLQFANPRSRLLPGFAASHLAVASIIVGVSVMIPAIMLALPSGGSVVGFGMSLAATVVGAWCICRDRNGNHAWSILYWLFFLYAILRPWIISATARWNVDWSIRAIAVDGNVGLTLFAWCVGLLGAAGLGARLASSRREMPAGSVHVEVCLSNQPTELSRRARRLSRNEPRSRDVTRQGRFRDRQLRVVARWTRPDSTLHRILLRQIASGAWDAYAMLLVIPLFPSVVFLIQSLSGREPGLPSTFLISGVLFLSAFVILTGMWFQLWPHLARESLYPQGRKAFVRELLVANACAATILCLGIGGAWLAASQLFETAHSQTVFTIPESCATLPAILVTCCAVPWAASFRNLFAAVLGMSLVAACAILVRHLAATIIEEYSWPVSLVSVSTLTTSTVAGVSWITFQRWCRLEFD